MFFLGGLKMDISQFNILYNYIEELRENGLLEDCVKKIEKEFWDGLYKLEKQITVEDFIKFENIATDMLTIIKYQQMKLGFSAVELQDEKVRSWTPYHLMERYGE